MTLHEITLCCVHCNRLMGWSPVLENFVCADCRTDDVREQHDAASNSTVVLTPLDTESLLRDLWEASTVLYPASLAPNP